MNDIENFINEKISENELRDLKYSERLNRFYIELYINNHKYFFKNISGFLFFLQIRKKKLLEEKIKKIPFISKFIEKTGFKDFDFCRLVELEKNIIKNKPKIIFELGAGMSTVWMSYIVNKFKKYKKNFDRVYRSVTYEKVNE